MKTQINFTDQEYRVLAHWKKVVNSNLLVIKKLLRFYNGCYTTRKILQHSVTYYLRKQEMSR